MYSIIFVFRLQHLNAPLLPVACKFLVNSPNLFLNIDALWIHRLWSVLLLSLHRVQRSLLPPGQLFFRHCLPCRRVKHILPLTRKTLEVLRNFRTSNRGRVS